MFAFDIWLQTDTASLPHVLGHTVARYSNSKSKRMNQA